MTLEPFQIKIGQDRLDLLGERLRSAVWADEAAGGEGWGYGVPGGYLRDLVRYWRDEYDWQDHEAAMNRWPHVRGEIDGVTVHALYERGSGPAPLPLVLSHGWPWTFWDFAKVIEPLAHPERFGGDPDDAFDVVVPSLPGSVFSAPSPSGVGWRRTAGLWVNLMAELGYERFGAHGGDSGAFVTAQLAHEFADRLIGAHLTYPALLGADTASLRREDFAPDEVGYFDARRSPQANLTHFLTHTLEPQTLAWAMQDSPVGLAAWMVQRRQAWSDCDGEVERRFSRDELITSFALYWLTGTVGGSLRFYADSFRLPWTASHDRQPALEAPTGIAVFPRELTHVPRALAEQHANLVHWTRMPGGGHFAPAEEPGLLVDDLRAFFRPLRELDRAR
ncbi:epoxide hydrolase family protein [Pseudofrankia saprophytica]|uniref:epoxide hydrolase family protein n=1 Tax=Pseudofrankia saprophytica TaxID=298655 RepID=UPI000234B0FD|nr:epoxide hydrolase family protein [Pseudofrankia saprophytica]